ncbi:carboxypeptidase regulatory-like domain-containing protein [Schlegelella sp. S2-27]|uniref:Carboxypeptidase regulatory-like domain-containing protein n=1 Tax=Caldimonas mangrovi TaxID=2944811 RepID=A0ABT0YLI1_9BURK|nr:carboxypeptidase regulatory-like domain-containing protein [Caldimonas mangrovi]MCM5679274.1 carboxypeptidase regulatory-like domain-containing protein [Caldimonas mangrovi]
MTIGLAACGGGGGGNDDDDGGDPVDPPASVGTVTGTVINAATGNPLANASVTIGEYSTQTGADGSFTLPEVAAADRAVAQVEAPGYAATFRITPVVDGASRSITAELLPVAHESVITVSTGGTATVPGTPARVVLPANALVAADGTPATGQASVELTPIDPAVNVDLMPGDFTASTPNGVQPLESFGAMRVDIRSSAGDRLNLAQGQTATIRIPVATRSATSPNTIPLFHFNESTGRWEEEGSATLGGNGTYYEGTVSHFSTWNADRLYASVNVTGCVRDEDNQPVSGIRIVSDGIDYSGTSSATTNANGEFTIAIKHNGRATLSSLAGTRVTNTVSVGPYTAATTLGTCLTLSSTASAVSVKLTWGAEPDDVDSHLYLPDGSHIWYQDEGTLTAAPWANLDVDDTTSFGPEVVTVRRLMVGTYRYAVNNYSETYDPGMTQSPVRVEFNANGTRRVFTPPSGEAAGNDWWTVFSFTVDAQCRISITPVNTWSPSAPAPSGSSTPTYCTAP